MSLRVCEQSCSPGSCLTSCRAGGGQHLLTGTRLLGELRSAREENRPERRGLSTRGSHRAGNRAGKPLDSRSAASQHLPAHSSVCLFKSSSCEVSPQFLLTGLPGGRAVSTSESGPKGPKSCWAAAAGVGELTWGRFASGRWALRTSSCAPEGFSAGPAGSVEGPDNFEDPRSLVRGVGPRSSLYPVSNLIICFALSAFVHATSLSRLFLLRLSLYLVAVPLVPGQPPVSSFYSTVFLQSLRVLLPSVLTGRLRHQSSQDGYGGGGLCCPSTWGCLAASFWAGVLASPGCVTKCHGLGNLPSYRLGGWESEIKVWTGWFPLGPRPWLAGGHRLLVPVSQSPLLTDANPAGL